MPVETQYWSGNSWVMNADDPKADDSKDLDNLCTSTTIPSPLVTFSADSSTGSGWTLTPEAFSGGKAKIKLEKASAGETTITASVPAWLKWTWGGVANSNPSAKATVGIYGTKESRKTVHIREMY